MLTSLLRHYLDGLCRPLAFFPRSSLIFAEKVAKKTAVQEALKQARRTWSGTDFNKGEQDEYHNLCFRGQNPLDDEFIRLAREICEPMLENQERQT